MGIAAITSVLTITVADKDNKTLDLGGTWTWSASLQGVPAAMWGAPIPAGQHPPPGADTLPGRLVGIAALMPRTAAPTGPNPIPLTALGYAPLDQNDSDYLPLAPGTAPVARQPQRDPTSPRIIAGSIASTSVAARGAIFAALAALGVDAGTDGALDALAASASRDYPDPPMLGAPWQEAA
jgi:hypothetical protein